MNQLKNGIGIVWAQYGPYHFARAAALARCADPTRVHAMEIASRTKDYRWSRTNSDLKLVTFCPGALAEEVSFAKVFREARRKFRELGIGVCLLPSYSPLQSLAVLFAARSLGIRTVMMNESHAGTARAGKLANNAKRSLVRLFDAALVGGRPQKRYFASLGLPSDKIFTGYDTIDNDYFTAKSDEIKQNAAENRDRFRLPERFFLSLGRMVAKKNLATLIRAYRKFLDATPTTEVHLVMVGSGEEEAGLRRLCSELGLPIYDKTRLENRCSAPPAVKPGVHFYGFQQINENPVFYAFADIFILPSKHEEWGLVVNEAMACGLPVIVSETAGCAEDLLEPAQPGDPEYGAFVSAAQQAGLQKKIRRNGFVFNPASAEELGSVLELCSSSPALRASMGRASRSIVENFSLETFGRRALLAARTAMGESPLPSEAATRDQVTVPYS